MLVGTSGWPTQTKERRTTLIKATLLLILLISSNSLAYTVSPAGLDLIPKAGKLTGVFVVENTGKQELKIGVQLKTMIYDDKGNEERGPIDSKDMVVFPKTATIPANSSAAFRVVYTGNQDVSVQKTFRVLFNEIRTQELDTEKKKGTATLGVVMAYANYINIKPKSGKKEPVVFEGLIEKDEQKYLSFKNDGDFLAKTEAESLVFKDKSGKSVKVLVSNLDGLKTPIFAKTKRIVSLPPSVVKDLDQKTLGVTLEFRK